MKEIVQTRSEAKQDELMGWLVWWTLRQGEYDLTQVKSAAKTAGKDNRGIPSDIQDRLKGRSISSAWRTATQLGASGMTIDPGEAVKRRALTRNGQPGDSSIRCLIVEATDHHAPRPSDWVQARTAAVLEQDRWGINVTWADWTEWDSARHDLERIIAGMEQKMSAIKGKIDDGRIRNAVLNWLKSVFRIAVRGAGGVYFVPTPGTPEEREELEQDLLAVREWLQSIDSPFSIVGITHEQAHSREDFVQDAINEIKAELTDIDEKLMKWENNGAMNDGSLQYSTGTQLERISEIRTKMGALKVALGDAVGIADAMIDLVEKKASSMHKSAHSKVQKAKAQRMKETMQQREAKAKQQREKKKGTAKSRKSRAIS